MGKVKDYHFVELSLKSLSEACKPKSLEGSSGWQWIGVALQVELRYECDEVKIMSQEASVEPGSEEKAQKQMFTCYKGFGC